MSIPECFRPIDRIPSEQWMNSQLSVARFYGGCTIHGERYVIDYTDGALVKASVLEADKKAHAASERAKWKAIKDTQGVML